MFRHALGGIFAFLCAFSALAAPPAAAQPGSGAEAPSPGRPRVTLESAFLVPDEVTGQLRVAGIEAAEDAPEHLYTGRFRHDGIIVVTGLEIVLEIPAGMHYIDGSATGPGAHVTFSVDGGRSFAPPGALHVVTDATGPEAATRRAGAEDYTHIRYELPGEYPPGTAGLVSFRARPVAAPIGDNGAP